MNHDDYDAMAKSNLRLLKWVIITAVIMAVMNIANIVVKIAMRCDHPDHQKVQAEKP